MAGKDTMHQTDSTIPEISHLEDGEPDGLLDDQKVVTPSSSVNSPGSPSNTLNHRHLYKNDQLEPHIRPIPEYEGAHRFDPTAKWTKAEERRLVRKVDRKILIWSAVMNLALQLDRGNITSALSDNMLRDLKLNTNDYNNGQMIFYVSFLCAELPAQLISKRLGPDVWLPIQMMLWSVVAMSQCRLNGRASFFATRCLLGVLEGGFVPEMILFLTYFYTGRELPIRLSLFWGSYNATNILGGLLGYGILHLRGLHGWEGWRYLFLIEGGITAAIGLFSLFWLPASPTQTKGMLRGKDGWFTEHEEVIMVNRILRDDPSKGDMHNRQALGLSDFWASITDYDNWGLYLVGITAFIPALPAGAYMTLTLRSMGFSTLNTNLLAIPAGILAIITMPLLALLSHFVNERSIVASIGSLWAIPLLIALVVLPDDANPWARYAILTLLLAIPFALPILVGWNSSNSNTVRTRTVSAALVNMSVQAGSIAATHIYNEDDKPYYRKGNKILIGISVWNVVLFLLIKLYFIKRNQWKAKRWNAMTVEEQAKYCKNTSDRGNKRLDFVFVH